MGGGGLLEFLCQVFLYAPHMTLTDVPLPFLGLYVSMCACMGEIMI